MVGGSIPTTSRPPVEVSLDKICLNPLQKPFLKCTISGHVSKLVNNASLKWSITSGEKSINLASTELRWQRDEFYPAEPPVTALIVCRPPGCLFVYLGQNANGDTGNTSARRCQWTVTMATAATAQYNIVCVFVCEFGTNKELERGAHKLYEPRQWRSEGHSRLRVERVHYPESSSSFLTVESHIKSFEFEFSKHDNHWRRPLYKMAWVTAEPEVPIN